METFYKLTIFPVVFGILITVGIYLYRFLNNKIKASETWLAILSYSLLLFSAFALLFFAGLFCLVQGYDWLMAAG